MQTKVFIDGSEGTTGLRIHERFEHREDIQILSIDPELRKDTKERKRLINESDITFLCLPDAASIEAVSMIESDHVRIIDPSTAHRTRSDWAYGFPELSEKHRLNIKEGKRISVPGCHATGFASLVYPLIAGQVISPEYPVSAFSITGYSGGGKGMIAEYESDNRSVEYDAPREYALSQQHKHVAEMKQVSGLFREPLFSPIVADYYSGMLVSVPLYTHLLEKAYDAEGLHNYVDSYYKKEPFIQVMPFGAEAVSSNMLSGISCSGWDGLKIFVTGNKERIVLHAQFDNLGKGASGAAIQCLNLMLGCEEHKGLNL
jgi:N-acetyl-gamma-glutamyl-phosphate reductase